MRIQSPLFAVLFSCLMPLGGRAAETLLELPARSQTEIAGSPAQWQTTEKTARWDPKKTAIVICDMWDTHTCPNSAARVAEMAPRMNEVIKAARARGVFIIHCPSDTMAFYKDAPQRKLAQSATPVTPKVPLLRWCSLDLG